LDLVGLFKEAAPLTISYCSYFTIMFGLVLAFNLHLLLLLLFSICSKSGGGGVFFFSFFAVGGLPLEEDFEPGCD
jgi:hypothetical protein